MNAERQENVITPIVKVALKLEDRFMFQAVQQFNKTELFSSLGVIPNLTLAILRTCEETVSVSTRNSSTILRKPVSPPISAKINNSCPILSCPPACSAYEQCKGSQC